MPKATKRTTKNLLAPAKRAAAEARRGNLDAATDVLALLASSGDAAASASLAEILAYQGGWGQVVAYATPLLARPSAARSDAVFKDMIRLVVRAARELDDEAILARAVEVMPAHYEGVKEAALREDAQPWVAQNVNTHREPFERAVAAARSTFKGRPHHLAAHVFELAVGFRFDDEVVSRWDSANPALGFDHAVSAARALARRGDEDGAWSALAARISSWKPVDLGQVAPVVLIVDPWLLHIMTDERCAQVLATPRGT